jgi:UDP-GlcNAc:undecaprenyl-phosphate GlcNAc-1-phosphate transferase
MSLLFIFASSLVLCLVLTPIMRSLAKCFGLVDRPDGRRKLQAEAVPLGGGLAILLSAALALCVAMGYSPLREKLSAQSPTLIGLGVAALLIAAVGLLDDAYGLRGKHKVLGQLAAVAIVISFGVVIRTVSVFGAEVNLGLLSWPFTAFFLLGTVNSLNLLDGLDGMLSCIGLMICLAVAAIAAMLGHWPAACIAAALAGALLGFLRYNFPPASIFMGDCGSMLVGLVIGVVAIEGSLKGPATVVLGTPLALLVLPICDTLAAIVRRKLTGRSIYVTDRGHLHHCLVRSGLSTAGVLCCVVALSLVTFCGAVASVAWHAEWVAFVSALVVFHILIATRLFGHAEFELLRKRLADKLLRAGGGPRRLEVRLQGSADWPSLWRDLVAWTDDLGLKSLCLDINAPALHEAYLGRWEREGVEPEEQNAWRAEIPLMVGGHNLGRLDIVGRRDGESASAAIAMLASRVGDLEFALGTVAGLVPTRSSPATDATGAHFSGLAPANGHHAAASLATENTVRMTGLDMHTIAVFTPYAGVSVPPTCADR